MSRRLVVENFIKEVGSKVLKRIVDNVTLVNVNNVFSDKIGDTKYFDAISFYQAMDDHEVMAFASHSKINHILNIEDPIVTKHLVLSFLMITQSQLFHTDPFAAITSIFLADERAIDNFLTKGEADFPDDLSSLRVSFCSSSEKEDVLETVSEALNEIPGASRHRSEIVLMVDELFTNALYNAPTTLMGNISKDRKNMVVLGSAREAVIQIAYDKKLKRAYIGCTDLFGTLAPSALIDKVYQTYNKGVESSLSFASGGAGIGVRLLFEKAESMSICVQKEEKSCLIFSIDLSQKKGGVSKKSLHLLQV